MRCSHCNFDNVPGVAVCQVCATPMGVVECSRCSFLNPSDYSYCGGCGQPMPGAEAQGSARGKALTTKVVNQTATAAQTRQSDLPRCPRRFWSHPRPGIRRLPVVPVRRRPGVRRADPGPGTGNGLGVVPRCSPDPYRRVRGLLYPAGHPGRLQQIQAHLRGGAGSGHPVLRRLALAG